MSYCRVVGCTYCSKGQSHYCRTCGVQNVAHFSRNCNKPRNLGRTILCRVVGCDLCVPGKSHYCKVCRKTDVTHRSANCPTSSQPVQHASGSQSGRNAVVAPPHVRNSVMTQLPPQHASLSVLTNINGVWHIYLSYRSSRLSCPNTPVTTGGSIDPNESSLNAAIRECKEEHGSNISINDIKTMFRTKTCDNYVAVVTSDHQVTGPSPMHAWEISSTRSISDISSNAIIQVNDVFLVPVNDLLAKEHVWKQSLISPLCNKLKRGEILLC